MFQAIEQFKKWLWQRVVQPNAGVDDLRFFFTMFDAGTTLLTGIIDDDLIGNGFDTVNHEDLREWMQRHGAQDITLDQGPFVRAALRHGIRLR